MRLRTLVTALLLAACAPMVSAATLNYRGTLQDGGRPANGSYDLQLTLYSLPQGGTVVGGPLTLYAVPVHAGGFSAQADFSAGAPAGQAWLAVSVREAGKGEFRALPVRSAVTAEAASVCPGAWTLDGNAGNAAGDYLGTADAQALVVKTAGQPALTIQPPGTHPGQLGPITGTTIVAGDYRNSAAQGVVGATVLGGGGTDQTDFVHANAAGADFSTVVGGLGNSANGDSSIVTGGRTNVASGLGSSVAGGLTNVASGKASIVGAGEENLAAGNRAATAGGFINTASGADAFVGGGVGATASGQDAAVVGGLSSTASGYGAAVVGGFLNATGGDFSFAAGAYAKVRDKTEAGNLGCDVGGCGDWGSFVWSDGNGASSGSYNTFQSTGPQQFLIHASGGVGINTPPPNNQVELTVESTLYSADYASLYLKQRTYDTGILISSGLATSTVANDPTFLIDAYNNNVSAMRHLLKIDGAGNASVSGGSWANLSDARLKRDIAPIDHALDTFLGLQGRTFEYIDPQAAMVKPGRRIGFIAQDVEQVVPQWVVENDAGFKMLILTGFEALSVEALRELRVEKDAEIAELRDSRDEKEGEIARLRKVVDDLSARLDRLEAGRARK